MPISDDTFTEAGRDVSELVEVVAPLVYEHVTEPVTPSDVLDALPEAGRRTATERRVAEQLDVDEIELTTQAVRLVLDSLVEKGHLSMKLVPGPGTPSGFRVFYRRSGDDDGVLDELRDSASSRLSGTPSGDNSDDGSSAADESTADAAGAPSADGGESTATFDAGTLLDDRYRLEADLGGKSETSVWKATDTDDDRAVIAKIGIGNSAELVTNEAALLETLQDAGLADAIPSDIDQFEIDDGVVLIKEYIEGLTLKELVDAEGGLDDDEMVYVLEQLTDIVASCHQNDIIVQNLLPEDIVLQPDGTVSLIDFDVSIDLSGSGPILHPQTPYTPPEVGDKRDEMDEPVGAPSDVYQLGLVGLFLRLGFLPQDRPKQGLSPADYGRESAVGSVIERATRQAVSDRFDSAIVFHRRVRATQNE